MVRRRWAAGFASRAWPGSSASGSADTSLAPRTTMRGACSTSAKRRRPARREAPAARRPRGLCRRAGRARRTRSALLPARSSRVPGHAEHRAGMMVAIASTARARIPPPPSPSSRPAPRRRGACRYCGVGAHHDRHAGQIEPHQVRCMTGRARASCALAAGHNRAVGLRQPAKAGDHPGVPWPARRAAADCAARTPRRSGPARSGSGVNRFLPCGRPRRRRGRRPGTSTLWPSTSAPSRYRAWEVSSWVACTAERTQAAPFLRSSAASPAARSRAVLADVYQN